MAQSALPRTSVLRSAAFLESRDTKHETRNTRHETRPPMTSTISTRSYRASGMLRRIIRLEASPAFKPQVRVRWMNIEPRPKVPIARNEHWVIDVLDDEQPNPNARWRRTTDPNDYGSHPPRWRRHQVLPLRLQPRRKRNLRRRRRRRRRLATERRVSTRRHVPKGA